MTLNERISAWFEPKPKREPYSFNDESTHKVWVPVLKKWHSFQHELKWVAIRWDTDEAANARLLDVMPEVDLTRDGQGWRCDPYDNTELGTSTYDPDRKTAIVLAFCKFAGIEP